MGYNKLHRSKVFNFPENWGKKPHPTVGMGRNKAVVDGKRYNRDQSAAEWGQAVHCKDSSYVLRGRFLFPFSSEEAILPFNSEATPMRKEIRVNRLSVAPKFLWLHSFVCSSNKSPG